MKNAYGNHGEQDVLTDQELELIVGGAASRTDALVNKYKSRLSINDFTAEMGAVATINDFTSDMG